MQTVDMRRGHPKFNLAMELLCSLPVAPAFAWFRELRDDLLGNERGVTISGLLNRLRYRGFRVDTTNPDRGGGRQVSLPRDGRAEVSAGRKYWEEVYGDGPATA